MPQYTDPREMFAPDTLQMDNADYPAFELPDVQNALLQEIKAELDEIRRDIRRNMIVAVSVLVSITLMGFGVLLTLH